VRNFVVLATVVAGSFQVADTPSITAEIAIEAALDQFREQKAPSGQCENCRGTGKLGDGRIVFDCPACGGTGVTKREAH